MSAVRIKLMEYDAKRSIVHLNMYLDDDRIPEECPPKILALLRYIDARSCKQLLVRTTTPKGDWDCEYSLDPEYGSSYSLTCCSGFSSNW